MFRVEEADGGFVRDRREQLISLQPDVLCSLFGGCTLAKGVEDKSSDSLLIQLFCFNKIVSYTEAVEDRIKNIISVSKRGEGKTDIEKAGRPIGETDPLTYLLFFNPMTSDELFMIAPLSFGGLMTRYLIDYYKSDTSTIKKDKAEITGILTNDYGFKKTEADKLQIKFYDYFSKYFSVQGFFHMIGEGKKIDSTIFARDLKDILHLQRELTEELVKQTKAKLKETAAEIPDEQNWSSRLWKLRRRA